MKTILYKISRALVKIIFPKLRYSQYIYQELLNELVNEESCWLELGCGHQILPEWILDAEKELVNRCKEIVGIDYDINSLLNHKTINYLIRGDICCLPFKDNSFNLITSNMVLEHVKDSLAMFKEIHRILTPGGKFLFHTPNKIGYITVATRILPEFSKACISKLLHGRVEEDIFPAYYKCNSEKEIIKLTKNSNLRILTFKYILSTPQFYIFPPFLVLELLYLRFVNLSTFKKLRINILTIVEKQY